MTFSDVSIEEVKTTQIKDTGTGKQEKILVLRGDFNTIYLKKEELENCIKMLND